jgi:hypothetical protein
VRKEDRIGLVAVVLLLLLILGIFVWGGEFR